MTIDDEDGSAGNAARVVDWAALEARVVDERFPVEAAVNLLVGDQWAVDAVDLYVRFGPGRDLAWRVIKRLGPPAARRRCLEIIHSDADDEARACAVDVLRDLAIAEDAPVVLQLLADPAEGVQNLGIGVLEYLVHKEELDAGEAEPYLAAAERHTNPNVREWAAAIRDIPNEQCGPWERCASCESILDGVYPYCPHCGGPQPDGRPCRPCRECSQPVLLRWDWCPSCGAHGNEPTQA